MTALEDSDVREVYASCRPARAVERFQPAEMTKGVRTAKSSSTSKADCSLGQNGTQSSGSASPRGCCPTPNFPATTLDYESPGTSVSSCSSRSSATGEVSANPLSMSLKTGMTGSSTASRPKPLTAIDLWPLMHFSVAKSPSHQLPLRRPGARPLTHSKPGRATKVLP